MGKSTKSTTIHTCISGTTTKARLHSGYTHPPPPRVSPFLLPGPERRLGIRFGLGTGGAVAIVRVKMAHAEPSGCQGRAGTSNREAQSEDHEGVSGMEQD